MFVHRDLEGGFETQTWLQWVKPQSKDKQPGGLAEASKGSGAVSPLRGNLACGYIMVSGQTDFDLILTLGSVCILGTNSSPSDCDHKPRLLYYREYATRKCMIRPIHPTSSVHC